MNRSAQNTERLGILAVHFPLPSEVEQAQTVLLIVSFCHKKAFTDI
jgi:hypothetical protein